MPSKRSTSVKIYYVEARRWEAAERTASIFQLRLEEACRGH